MWESPDDVPYDVLVEPGGSLLVGTGAKGKLYRLSGDPVLATLVTRADAQQITALADDGAGGILLAASNPGRLLRLSSKPAPTGILRLGRPRHDDGGDLGHDPLAGDDAARDGDRAAHAHRQHAHAGCDVECVVGAVHRRAGLAHRQPEGALPAMEGRADRRQRRQPGAHLGVRRLPAAQHAPDRRQRHRAPARRRVPAALPHRRSRAGRHRRHARIRAPPYPGTPSIGQTLGRRTFQKSLQTFVWSARDTDGDRLQYALAYRREGDRTWTVLKDGLDDDVFTWDTTTVPDGTYVIKVTASDGTANAPALALQGERESQSFEIDNTPPAVTVAPAGTGAAAATVRFTVQDSQTAIQKVEYASAGDRWRQAYPIDGLLDSREERFELVLGAGAKSPVVVRATDASATSRPRSCAAGALRRSPLTTSGGRGS